MKKSLAVVIILVILAILGFFAYEKFLSSKKQNTTPAQTQTQNQNQAADAQTAGWSVYQNAQYGFTLKYPSDFFDVNQEPRLLAGDCNYQVFPGQCPNINNIVIDDMAAQGGDLEVIKSNFADANYWDNPQGTKQTVGDTQYCLYSTGDAGAGHSFNYYYFATVKNNKCVIVYLATSTTNCDNYLPLESGNTQQAQNYQGCLTKNTNQPKILDTIISTFKFTK